jgi:catecholate siderophore receptor
VRKQLARTKANKGKMVMGALVATAAVGATPATAAPVGSANRLRYEHAMADLLRTMRWEQAESSAGAQAASQRFDIAPGPLGIVLAAFEKQTGISATVIRDALLAVQSPGVTGLFSPQQAIERLLTGTGIAFRFTSATTLELDLIKQTEFVEVSGAAPPRRASSPQMAAPLRDVPQTVTVIPSAVIESQGATTLRDVLRNVTGISVQAGEGGVPAGDNLSIRGFSARTDFFIDGVRDSGGYTRDPFNVEQVEVIKGPSSSYSGRGSTGGSVNMATKTPHLAQTQQVSFGGGTAAYKRGTIDINQPMTGDTAVRLNAMWTDSESPGRDAVSSRRWGVAPSLAVGVGKPTRLTLSYSHLAQENVPDYGIPWVPAANTALREYADQPPPVNFDNFYGLTGRDYEDTLTDTATAIADHDFGQTASLRSLVRFGRTRRDSLITAPRFESNASTAVRRTDWKSRDQSDAILAHQTDVTSRFSTRRLKHTVVTGFEVAREMSENWNRVELNAAAPSTDLYAPNPAEAYASRLLRDGAVTDATATSAAGFVVDTVEVGPIQVTGGLRFDRFALDYLSRSAANVDTRLERTDEMVSWRGGVVYKPRPQGSIYAGAGTSLNPSTEGLSLTASTVSIDPERTRSFEAGTKWDVFGGRLGVNAAAFHTIKSNARTPGLNPGDPPTVLQGEHVVTGFEAGANGSVNSRWQLFGSYTFMHSEITRSNTAAELGREFANTPDHSLSLWTMFRLPWRVDVGGGAQYVGDRFNNNTGARTAPAYWLVDAMAAYRVSDRLTLRLNGFNLADKRYIDRVGGGHFIPGAARSATLTLDVGL